MKKILYITSRSDIGGGPKHLYDLVKGLEGKVEAYIASPVDEPYGSLFKEISTEWFELPHRKFTLFSFLRLLYFCRERGIGIVHSHGRGAGVYSRLLCLWGVKVIHTFHGVHIENSNKGKVKFLLEKCLKYLTMKFISVSIDERELAIFTGIADPDDIVVIANGVDIKSIQKAAPLDLSEYRSEGDIIFGTLSRLCHQKGIDLLIEILATNSFDKKWKFIIAGSGEDELALKEKVKNLRLEKQIIFLGAISRPYSFLKSIDCYFSTSRGEGLPISVLEAFALGLPCVLSNVIGHKSISDGDGQILLHNFDDFIDVCKEFKNLDSSNVRELCRGKYSLDVMIAKTFDLY